MNDEETVALIVGGHSFGKTHGAAPAPSTSGPEPEARRPRAPGSRLEERARHAARAATRSPAASRAPGRTNPTKWDNGFLENLFKYEWELTESPAGAKQWKPKNPEAQGTVPDAHDPKKRHAPMMLTTDLALKVDPIYAPIAKRFHENPDQLADAFARAWFKLLHRDMGPRPRYLGPWVPEPQLWQDPVPAVDHALVGEQDVADLKRKVLDVGAVRRRISSPRPGRGRVSFRGTDKRGGANGARIRLEPQKELGVERAGAAREGAGGARADPAGIQRSAAGRKVSLADLIVLGGCAAVEEAAQQGRARRHASRSRPAARTRSQEQTDVDTFDVLEPVGDGFRNYLRAGDPLSPETRLLDRANLLRLTAPEMTVLVGGMRALGANHGESKHGVFTDKPGTLTNDFFVNLLDVANGMEAVGRRMRTCTREATASSGEGRWTATAADLVFGAHSQLRALAEVYASDDAQGEVRARLRARPGTR